MRHTLLLAVLVFFAFPISLYGQDPNVNDRYFSETKTKIYNTEGNQKAEGLNITFKYPSTWISKPGSSENSVRKFTKKHPKALTVFVVVIRNIKEGKRLSSKSDVKKYLEGMKFKRMDAPIAELISGNYTTINNFPFAFIRNFVNKKTRNSSTIFFGDSYMTAFKRKILSFQFYTFAAPGTRKEELEHIHTNLSKKYEKTAYSINIKNTFLK